MIRGVSEWRSLGIYAARWLGGTMFGMGTRLHTRFTANSNPGLLSLAAALSAVMATAPACTEKPKEVPPAMKEDRNDPIVKAAKALREANKGKKLDDPTKDYVTDPPEIPARVGAKRIFLQLAKVRATRDLAFIPNTNEFIVTGLVGGVTAYWKMDLKGDKPAQIVLPTPLYDKSGPRSARNRTNWYLGTPSIAPDGKHIIFAGVAKQPTQTHANTMGLVPIEGGVIRAIVAKDVTYAQDPDIHPDNKTVVFSTCTELRVGTLKGREDQVLESVVIFKLSAADTANPNVCTVNHPRWSPDGKRVVFEVVGLHVDVDVADSYGIPERDGPADFMLEPWIVNADGKKGHRLLSKQAFKDLGGRVAEGGTKNPDFSADGTQVYFTHGRALARVDLDGNNARFILPSNMVSLDGHGTIMFVETDPTLSSDGRTLVAATRLGGKQEAPAGVTIVDLTKVTPMTSAELPTRKNIPKAPPVEGGGH